MLSMPRYEVRCYDNHEWREISEVEIMNGLYKTYKRVTPAIKEMMKGKEIKTPDGFFRLRFEVKV